MEDGEDEGGLHLPVTIFLEDVSNHPQEGPRWLLLKKYPTWIFGNSIDVLKRHHRFHLEPAFTNNWRKASASLKNQQESVGHTFAMDTKQKQTSGSKIANVLDKGHSVLVMESRKYTRLWRKVYGVQLTKGIAQRSQ